jgi:hypothetical protein
MKRRGFGSPRGIDPRVESDTSFSCILPGDQPFLRHFGGFGNVVAQSIHFADWGAMDVVIQLSPVTEQSASSDKRRLTAVRKVLGKLALEPMHPGIDDPELSNTFRVSVPDAKSAAKVVEAVRKVPSVAAAYIKPQDEAP